MKKNPIYRRLLRIECVLILFLILCILSVKSCFGSHEREASPHTAQEITLTEPAIFQDDASSTQRSGDVSGPPEAVTQDLPSVMADDRSIRAGRKDNRPD